MLHLEPLRDTLTRDLMILVIDNYDSFTYNLVQALGTLGAAVETVRNDKIDWLEIDRLRPDRIVLSPGPRTPEDAPLCTDVVRRLGERIPILGVCLGLQCMARAFGASVGPARRLMHGKTSEIRHDGKGLFAGIPNPFRAMRYHSLAVDAGTFPPELEVSARSEDGEVMGLRHRHRPLEGVQFHPESYRTEAGLELLRNFLELRAPPTICARP